MTWKTGPEHFQENCNKIVHYHQKEVLKSGYVFSSIVEFAVKKRDERQRLLIPEFNELVRKYIESRRIGGVFLKEALGKLVPYYGHLVALPDSLRSALFTDLFKGDFDEPLQKEIDKGIRLKRPSVTDSVLLPSRRYIDAVYPFTEIWIEDGTSEDNEDSGCRLMVVPQLTYPIKFHKNYGEFVKNVSTRYALWWLNHPSNDDEQEDYAFTFRAIERGQENHYYPLTWTIVRASKFARSFFDFQTVNQAAYHGAQLAHILWEESVKLFGIDLRKAQVQSPEHHHIALVEAAL